MKNAVAFVTACTALGAAAFPAAVLDQAANSEAGKIMNNKFDKRVFGIAPGFNAKAQYISTTGKHAWVAPGPTDQRGPCPGLNAFANHGYIPHNGVATITQYIAATTAVVGMGIDLAAFLAIYGAIFDGDLTSWSINGPSPLVPGVPLLGTPGGLTLSHNKYEADVSPTRGDLYQVGNDYQLVLDQFTGLYGLQASESEETSNYELGVQTTWRVKRFQDSISQNPYFFNNFFSGLLVQPAAYTFQFRFMANHSEQYPQGRLSQSVLKSWFGVTGDYPNFSHTPGYERIPDNWYRRAIGDEYTIPYFLLDVAGMALENPQFLSFGGNIGHTNSFIGLDPVNLTQGVYNTQQLVTEPGTLGCFFFQFLVQQAPDLITDFAVGLTGALSKLTDALHVAQANLSCPTLDFMNRDQINAFTKQFPGNTKLKSDGTY